MGKYLGLKPGNVLTLSAEIEKYARCVVMHSWIQCPVQKRHFGMKKQAAKVVNISRILLRQDPFNEQNSVITFEWNDIR